jgi:hypothetical protein
MSDVLIPPDLSPTEESAELVDTGTSVFVPAFGQGQVQRSQYYEPYLRVTQTWRGLRLEDKARMMSVLGRLRGRYNTLRALTGFIRRGSFPAPELLSNNTFANGTTGHSPGGDAALSVADKTLRITRIGATGSNCWSSQQAVYTQYSPHVARAFMQNPHGQSICVSASPSAGLSYTFSSSAEQLSRSHGVASTGGSITTYLDNQSSSAFYRGAYVDVPWWSLARCVLIDNGQNMLTYSDQFDNAVWQKTGCTIGADVVTSPIGTNTGDSLLEDGTTGTHQVYRPVTVASSAADFSFSVAVAPSARGWAQVYLYESTGQSEASVYVNLLTGATGTVITGANWANTRVSVQNYGGSWWKVSVTARKTNAETTIYPGVRAATADGVNSYASTAATTAIYLWRATLAASGVPTRLVLTTTSATTGTQQTGNALYVKGGSASTTGAHLAGDLIEINGELKMVTASVDYDAAGLGYIQFAPALFRSPADNDPVIINQPFGKFMLDDNPKWSNRYGQYADLTLSMRHIYE